MIEFVAKIILKIFGMSRRYYTPEPQNISAKQIKNKHIVKARKLVLANLAQIIKGNATLLSYVDAAAVKLAQAPTPASWVKYNRPFPIYYEAEILRALLGDLGSNGTESDLTQLFHAVIEAYRLDSLYTAYYRAEMEADPPARSPKHSAIDRFLHEFAGHWVRTYVDQFLLRDDPDVFQEKLIQHRHSLTPSYLFQSCVTLQFGYRITPDYRLFSILFGERLESIPDITSATQIGVIVLDKPLRWLLTREPEGLTTARLIAELDEFFLDRGTSEKDWFEKALSPSRGWKIDRDYSLKTPASPRLLVAAELDYSQWAEFYHFPEGHRFSSPTKLMPIAIHESECRPRKNISILAEQMNVSRAIQNYIRRLLGLPDVGEGWINEMNLLNLVRLMAEDFEVIHQWSPKWLKPQRIDIAIPELGLAFEYNGAQHYQAVEVFGGEKGFRDVLARDARKRNLSRENQIELIEIRYDTDDLEAREIVTAAIERHRIVWRKGPTVEPA